MGATQSGGVRVVREPEDRDFGVVLRDVVGIESRDVRDHEIGGFDTLRGLEPMLGKNCLELAPYEEIDPTQQDRRHARARH